MRDCGRDVRAVTALSLNWECDASAQGEEAVVEPSARVHWLNPSPGKPSPNLVAIQVVIEIYAGGKRDRCMSQSLTAP